jgi:hypothetical protein
MHPQAYCGLLSAGLLSPEETGRARPGLLSRRDSSPQLGVLTPRTCPIKPGALKGPKGGLAPKRAQQVEAYGSYTIILCYLRPLIGRPFRTYRQRRTPGLETLAEGSCPFGKDSGPSCPCFFGTNGLAEGRCLFGCEKPLDSS